MEKVVVRTPTTTAMLGRNEEYTGFSSGGGAEGNEGGGGGEGEATKTVSFKGWGRISLRSRWLVEEVAGETAVKRKTREKREKKKEKGLGRAPMSESNRGMS